MQLLQRVGGFFSNIITHARSATGRVLRESGLQLDYQAGRHLRDVANLEPLNRHRNILALYNQPPTLSSTTYVAPNATVVGSVYAAANTYISFGTTVKGINQAVRLGNNTSIGENCVLECSNYVSD